MSVPAVGIVTISLMYILLNIILVISGHIKLVTSLSSVTFINLITIPLKNVPQVCIMCSTKIGYIKNQQLKIFSVSLIPPVLS